MIPSLQTGQKNPKVEVYAVSYSQDYEVELRKKNQMKNAKPESKLIENPYSCFDFKDTIFHYSNIYDICYIFSEWSSNSSFLYL